MTSGSYQLQVRPREEQEWAGSSINYADIRYAMNGVHLRGLPGESPLIGEAAEDESVRNGQIYANNGVATGGGVTTSGFGGGSFSASPTWISKSATALNTWAICSLRRRGN
ncbi:MAG: hypothetical protein R3C56_21600 [Pirellulaceae bacterium]